jgi:hypothetical protein
MKPDMQSFGYKSQMYAQILKETFLIITKIYNAKPELISD